MKKNIFIFFTTSSIIAIAGLFIYFNSDNEIPIVYAPNEPIRELPENTPEIKIATPYFKPQKNLTGREPDYYIHETESWLVFPHELEGLSLQEIKKFKPELSNLIDRLKPYIP